MVEPPPTLPSFPPLGLKDKEENQKKGDKEECDGGRGGRLGDLASRFQPRGM